MSKRPTQGPRKSGAHEETVQVKAPSRLSLWMTTLRHNLLLAVASGVLAFAGAVGGAMLVQQAIWDEQTHYDLTQKRIDLIERTVALMGKSTAVMGQERNYTKSFITAMAKTAGDPTKVGSVFSKMLKESSDARCKVADAHAEFMTMLELNDIFFGDRTHKAVRALQEVDPWWMADSSLKADLLDALRQDFYELNRQRKSPI